MRITHEIKLEQTQKLIITPELQQAITLLQLSTLELSNYLEEELMANPVLEINEPEVEETKEIDEVEKIEKDEKDEKGVDWEEYFQEHLENETSNFKQQQQKEENNYESYVSSTLSLQEHLLSQLGLIKLSSQEILFSEFLIGNIDRNGYLKGDLAEFSRFLNVPEVDLEKVLKRVQSFDPTGVGARSLMECLLIQLNEKDASDPLAIDIVKSYLPQVADNHLKEIAGALQVDLSQVQKAVDFIRTLDPKPGCTFGGSRETKYIVPDMIVEKVKDEYIIIVNDSYAPRLTINPYYRSILKEKKESLTSSFIKKRLDSALWLIRSIEQRRMTLYKVMEQIVDIQKNFFEKGLKYLSPLTLKDIADKIEMHESTVSRATTNKYVQTPRGIFSLKFFFSGGVENHRGEAVATSSIKHYLKELIKSENPNKPFSDQKMADILEEKGMLLSRRTVAKYREEMNIPSSAKRKRH